MCHIAEATAQAWSCHYCYLIDKQHFLERIDCCIQALRLPCHIKAE